MMERERVFTGFCRETRVAVRKRPSINKIVNSAVAFGSGYRAVESCEGYAAFVTDGCWFVERVLETVCDATVHHDEMYMDDRSSQAAEAAAAGSKD